MNDFIEKNKPLLRVYCITANALALALLLLPVVLLSIVIAGGLEPHQNKSSIMFSMGKAALSMFLLGLLLLVVGQFIRYLYEPEYRPGWMLRHGKTILYFYGVVILGGWFLGFVNLVHNIGIHWVAALLGVVPSFAKAIVFFGLGNILKRILPVVEEFKALV